MTYLSTINWVCDEDFEKLTECLLLSYFSKAGDTPHQLLYNLLTDNGYPADHHEQREADTALGIIEEIERMTALHLPGLSGLGFMPPALTLNVEDVSLRGKTKLLISLNRADYNLLKTHTRR